jgi:nucleoside-triphosphatase THEP1
VGSYEVDVPSFESLALPMLRGALEGGDRTSLVVIDEVRH